MELVVVTLIALAAFAAVLVPLFRRGAGSGDEREFATGTELPAEGFVPVGVAASAPLQPQQTTEDDVEREVMRYRVAVRAGTICRRCGQANPEDSRFCYECGVRLARADAK